MGNAITKTPQMQQTDPITFPSGVVGPTNINHIYTYIYAGTHIHIYIRTYIPVLHDQKIVDEIKKLEVSSIISL